MKKLILTVFIICGIIPLISSCGKDSNNETAPPTIEHVHNFSETHSYDKTKHWKYCSCGEKNNEGEHLFGAWILVEDSSNEKSKKRICSICGYEQIKDEEVSEHTHMFSAEWKKDNTYHWNECSCGEKTNIEIHNGALNKNCKCGYLITGSEGLDYTLLYNNTYKVSGKGKCIDSNIVIPRIYDGRIVTSIGNSAFSKCSSLTSIEIPNSVTSIGESAFYNCSSLTSIEIPNSVTSIGSSAFFNCSGLTSLIIPNSVTSIGSDAFRKCSSLISISVDENNEYYDSRNNCNAIIETLTNTLIVGCVNTKIPDSVTSIGEDAFRECIKLTSIIIPNSVTSIGEHAFRYCTSLTSVTIGNSVTSIGEDAFCKCSSLTSIEIPNSVTSIGSYAFSGCSSLESITIPFVGATLNGTKSNTHFGYIFGASSYSDNGSCVPSSLKKVIITGGTSLGSYAFLECSSLTSVTIGNSVTSIGEDAFSGCSSLTSIIIPNSVTSIGLYAFYNCSSLTSIEIPNSVTSIGEDAFSGCSSLTSIIIPNSVTSIGDGAFYNCSSLASIIIPNSVTSIGSYAFYYCRSLTSIYYKGTSSEWNSISIGSWNSDLKNANRYYYSETKPTDTTNKYWHYVDGVITIW